MTNRLQFEVIIIGGSFAGLSAALTLVRSLKKILIIDNAKPCNQQTPAAHNFITHDGQPPSAILEQARKEVMAYEGVRFINATAQTARAIDGGFEIETDNGSFTGKKLLFATGLKDIIPCIPGFAACWGISILHCPYCHGFEARNTPTALFANEEAGFNMAITLLNWSDSLTMFTDGPTGFTKEQEEQLSQLKVNVVEEKIISIVQEDGQMTAIELNNKERHAFPVMYARIPAAQRCSIPEVMGCTFNEHGCLVLDAEHQTTIKGIFAAGDNAVTGRTLAVAVASGNQTAISINHRLIMERFDQ